MRHRLSSASGCLAYDQKEVPDYASYTTDSPSGPVSSVRATHDESFFYLEINTAADLT